MRKCSRIFCRYAQAIALLAAEGCGAAAQPAPEPRTAASVSPIRPAAALPSAVLPVKTKTVAQPEGMVKVHGRAVGMSRIFTTVIRSRTNPLFACQHVVSVSDDMTAHIYQTCEMDGGFTRGEALPAGMRYEARVGHGNTIGVTAREAISPEGLSCIKTAVTLSPGIMTSSRINNQGCAQLSDAF
jgi:hypothetical protein